MAILFLFTANYPYSSGEEFLESEIRYLSKAFEAVYVIPRFGGGEQRAVPANVKVLSRPLFNSRWQRFKRRVNSLTTVDFYWECIRAIRFLNHKKLLRHIHNYISMPISIADFVRKFIFEHSLENAELVFYSYWLDVETLAFLHLKKRFPSALCWSRAHGYDIYPEQNDPPIVIFRPKIFSAVKAVFCDSVAGHNYLVSKYPQHIKKIKCHYLGTSDPGFTTRSSDKGEFRIVTCSFLVPVKRVSLFINSLSLFAGTSPGLKIEWTHIGAGPLFSQLQAQATSVLPKNVCWSMRGYLRNHDVIGYYEKSAIDLFVNVSSSEGVPVSIMEALSCGIPIMATDVGGNREVVNDETGLLLSANPDCSEIANGMLFFSTLLPEKVIAMKKKCKQHWDKFFSAESNYRDFSERVLRGR